MKTKSGKKRKVDKFEWSDSHSINHPKSRLVFDRFIKSDDGKRMWVVYEAIIEKVSEEL